MENILTYYQCRASQEKAAALHAAHPRARQAHLDMAQEYEQLIRRVASKQRKLETYTPPQAFAEPQEAGAPKLEQLGLPDKQFA